MKRRLFLLAVVFVAFGCKDMPTNDVNKIANYFDRDTTDKDPVAQIDEDEVISDDAIIDEVIPDEVAETEPDQDTEPLDEDLTDDLADTAEVEPDEDNTDVQPDITETEPDTVDVDTVDEDTADVQSDIDLVDIDMVDLDTADVDTVEPDVDTATNWCLNNPCNDNGDTSALCTNETTDYSCSCSLGFEFTGGGCHDIDECVTLSNPCDDNEDTGATCNNTTGGYTCTCSNSGFSFTSGSCRDVNECTTQNNPCNNNGDVAASCNNVVGSYSCTCSYGFQNLEGICKSNLSVIIENGTTVVVDDLSGLMWQRDVDYTYKSQGAADTYCQNLTHAGHDDWRLPTISELRTIFRGCAGTITGGSCGVTDSCLAFSGCYSGAACYACTLNNGPGEEGFYWQTGIWNWQGADQYGWNWSSSVRTDDTASAWMAGFGIGGVNLADRIGGSYQARCVREPL